MDLSAANMAEVNCSLDACALDDIITYINNLWQRVAAVQSGDDDLCHRPPNIVTSDVNGC